MIQDGTENIIPKVEPFTPDPSQFPEYEGEYYSEELGTFYRIMDNDSSLVVQHQRHGEFGLKPLKKDEFAGETWFFGSVKFERDENNVIREFRVSNGRVRNLLFTRMP